MDKAIDTDRHKRIAQRLWPLVVGLHGGLGTWLVSTSLGWKAAFGFLLLAIYVKLRTR